MNNRFTLTFVLLLLIHPFAKSQTYESMFGNTSTEWAFAWWNLPGAAQDTVFVEKDTVVNGLAYKKIGIKTTSIYEGGLLREDLNTGKVWYRDLEIQHGGLHDTNEILAFDFSLDVGDTFDISNLVTGPDYSLVHGIVDSINIINGLKHIYFRGQYTFNEPYTIIEGHGSNLGVIWKSFQTKLFVTPYFLCGYKDGQKTNFENLYYNGACSLPTGITPVGDAAKTVSIFPIPAHNQITVSGQNGSVINSCTIKNIAGKRILEEQVKKQRTTLDISAIPSGLYIVMIELENGMVIHRKLEIY